MGISGLAAYELGMALIWKVDRLHQEKKKDKGNVDTQGGNGTNPSTSKDSLLREARDLLAKATDILSYEAPGTNHGLLGQNAKAELAKMDVM